MNKMKDPEFLRNIVRRGIESYRLPVTDIFIAESNDSKHAMAKLRSYVDFALVTDITKPDDNTNMYSVNNPILENNVEHGTLAKLDVNDYNMQFNGYITDNQIDILLNSKMDFFQFSRLNSTLYRSNTNNSMVWLENSKHEFLYIRYVDEIGKQYWEVEKFNSRTFTDYFWERKVDDK